MALYSASVETSRKQTNQQDWKAIAHVIQVIQMQQINDWRKKYFTEEQLNQIEDLNKQYYTKEQQQKLAEWGKNWSQADEAAIQQWIVVLAELKRLVASGQDPASAESQAFAKKWVDLIQGFTHRDEGIMESLRNMYKGLSEMPAGQAPYPLPYNEEEREFLLKAIEVYQENK